MFLLPAFWTKFFLLAARTLRDITNSLSTRLLSGDLPSEMNLWMLPCKPDNVFFQHFAKKWPRSPARKSKTFTFHLLTEDKLRWNVSRHWKFSWSCFHFFAFFRNSQFLFGCFRKLIRNQRTLGLHCFPYETQDRQGNRTHYPSVHPHSLYFLAKLTQKIKQMQPLDELWFVLLICIIRNGPWALRENSAPAASQSERTFYRLQALPI